MRATSFNRSSGILSTPSLEERPGAPASVRVNRPKSIRRPDPGKPTIPAFIASDLTRDRDGVQETSETSFAISTAKEQRTRNSFVGLNGGPQYLVFEGRLLYLPLRTGLYILVGGFLQRTIEESCNLDLCKL